MSLFNTFKKVDHHTAVERFKLNAMRVLLLLITAVVLTVLWQWVGTKVIYVPDSNTSSFDNGTNLLYEGENYCITHGSFYKYSEKAEIRFEEGACK